MLTSDDVVIPVDAADKLVNKEGVLLQFENVKYVVTKKNVSKEILKGISGQCAPGRLLAIMGASGAGKTTLLDVLACNSYGGEISGTISCNGQPRTRKTFQRISCYVQQRDTLLATATVREAITTSALLKLPRSMTKQEKLDTVDAVIKELDLEACANVLIGDESLGIKGCSGGQKRRVSVGVELVKDPSLIFLDEPTSGLDSETAGMLMATLVQLARKDRTVVCTIHQPNSDITSKFDDLLLLSRGLAVYNGPWDKSVQYFAAQGFLCPQYANPTDYYMSVIRDENSTQLLADALHKHQAIEGSALDKENSTASLDSTALQRSQSTLATIAAGQTSTGALYQMWVLCDRFMKTWMRNPSMFWAELIQYIFIALLVGLIYLNVPDTESAGTFDRISAIWFSLAVLSFTPSYTSAVNWDKERLLLKRELAGSQYKASAYFWAKTVTMVPFEVLQTILYVAISYFMVGFQANAAKFFINMAVMVMFMITSESIGLLVGIVARTATNAVLLLTLLLLLLLSFSGFLSSTVKDYFVWIQKASYLTYSLVALTQNEFQGLTLYNNGQPVDGATLIPATLDNGLSLGVNISIVVAQLVGYRLLAWGGLVLAARIRWL